MAMSRDEISQQVQDVMVDAMNRVLAVSVYDAI